MLNNKLIAGAMATVAFASPATVLAAQAAAQTSPTKAPDQGAARRLIGTEAARITSEGERGLVVRLRRTDRGLQPAERLDPRDIITDGNERRLARSSSSGPVAHAACPLCIGIGIAVSAAARAVAVRMAGRAAAAAAARAAARATLPLIRSGAAKNFPRLKFPLRQLEKKFKHAPEFGVVESRGSQGFAAFEQAVKRHMADGGTSRIFGSIKGKDGFNVHAVHFYNPLTRQVASFTPDGDFITAYYIKSDFQATRLAAFGHLGKVGKW